MKNRDEPTLSEVVDKISRAGDSSSVSVGDVLEEFGDRSLAPVLLVPALITATPVSGIPGVPTLAGLMVGVIVVQMMIGRNRLWVPQAVARRRIARARIDTVVGFLRKPASFIDRLMKPRLAILADRPWNYLALFLCFAIAILTPVMEFVPFVVTIASLAIALFAAGIFARDGLVLLGGYTLLLGTLAIGILVA